MKIEKVTIENLNSIEKAEICFNEGILAHEPLFLICGETGTGKSTILDAITLALFDKSPRYENTLSTEYIENGQSKVNSTANILRKGTSECKAELTFTVANQTYVALWRIRKSRNDKYSMNNRRLLSKIDGEVIADNINSVNDTIKSIIGLNYEQFLRSVLLAQGQFSTFLNSEKNKQTEILELLTGTEIYSHIANAIKEERRKAEMERNNAKISLDTIDARIITEEEENNLVVKQNQLEVMLQELSVKIKENDSALKWMADFLKLQHELSEYKSQYEEARNCLNSDVTIKTRDIIRDYKATEQVRELKRRSEEVENEILDREKEIMLLRSRFLKQLSSFNAFKIQKNILSLESEKLEVYIKEHETDESLYNNINLVIALLNDASAAKKSIMELSKQISDNENDKKDKISLRVSKEEEKRKSSDDYDLLNDNLRQNETKLSSFNIESLNNEYKNINDTIRQKNDRIAKLEKICDTLNQYFTLKNVISDKEKELLNCETIFPDVCSKFAQAEDKFKNVDNTFNNMRVLAEDWMKEYRAKLKDGEPCPLCGSLEHKYKDESIVDSLLDTIEKQRNDARNIYLAAFKEKNGMEAELKSLQDVLKINKKNLSEFEKRLDDLCDNKPVYDIEKIKNVINSHMVEVDKYKLKSENIFNQLSLARDLQNGINSLRDKLDEKKHAVNNLEKEILEINKNVEILSNRIDSLKKDKMGKESLFDGKILEAGKYLTHDNWLDEWKRDESRYMQILEDNAEKWFKVKENYDIVRKKIDEYESINRQCIEYIEKITSLISEWSVNVADKASFEVGNLVSDFSTLYYETKSSVDFIGDKKRQYESSLSSVRDFVNNNNLNINEERLDFLYNISNISEYERYLRDKEDAFNRAENSYKLKYNELQKHHKLMTLPMDISVEYLNSESERLKQKSNDLVEEKMCIKAEIDNNAKNKIEALKLKELYKVKEEQFALWRNLADTLGTTESNNFRQVAQLYTLKILLERSNFFLKQISSRYEFSCSMNSWAIMVVDKNMGGIERVASSLSGGETFIVSLALALGLAALNDTGFSVNMLFIDEGFGSLDYDSLDMVMGVLENLNRLGRQVGIISHVEMLRDRVPAKIQLVKKGNSSSVVSIVKS